MNKNKKDVYFVKVEDMVHEGPISLIESHDFKKPSEARKWALRWIQFIEKDVVSVKICRYSPKADDQEDMQDMTDELMAKAMADAEKAFAKVRKEAL